MLNLGNKRDSNAEMSEPYEEMNAVVKEKVVANGFGSLRHFLSSLGSMGSIVATPRARNPHEKKRSSACPARREFDLKRKKRKERKPFFVPSPLSRIPLLIIRL
jgi:hypothetical protein